jgi:hypothetical protein
LKRVGLHLLLVLAGFTVALLLGEATIFALGMGGPRFSVSHDLYGTTLRPGAAGWQTSEGRAWVQINSRGFRDRERSIEKPLGTIRVAVVGDSFTSGLQVELEQTFPAIAEQRIAACPARGGRTIEVLNFGVPNFSTVQELLLLRNEVLDYQPDIVVLAVFTANDIIGNVQDLARHPGRAPSAAIRDGTLVLRPPRNAQARDSLASQLSKILLEWSRIARVANGLRQDEFADLLARGLERSEGEGAGNTPASAEGYLLYLEQKVYVDQSSKPWRHAWQVQEATLLALRDESAARGAALLLVTLSNPIQVLPHPAIREGLMADLGVKDLFYPDSRLRGFANQHGIPVLTLATEFQRYADDHHTYLHGFPNTMMGTGHWNAEGHRLAGQLLAQTVCSELPQFAGTTERPGDGPLAAPVAILSAAP